MTKKKKNTNGGSNQAANTSIWLAGGRVFAFNFLENKTAMVKGRARATAVGDGATSEIAACAPLFFLAVYVRRKKKLRGKASRKTVGGRWFSYIYILFSSFVKSSPSVGWKHLLKCLFASPSSIRV